MDTLVLANDYTLVNQVTWQRAVTLLFQGHAETIEEYKDWNVRSVTTVWRVPAVIRLLRGAAGWRKRGVKFSRENVYTRDKGRCQYCHAKVTKTDSTFDHVTPRALGGITRWENIVIACLPCNQKKGGKTPEQAGMRLLSKPARPPSMHANIPIALPSSGKVPAEWQDYLRSTSYWSAALEE